MVESRILLFFSAVAFVNLTSLAAAKRNCTATVPDDFGVCFEDLASGTLWQEKFITLEPADNGTIGNCENYRVNQVEKQACSTSVETIEDYRSSNCGTSGNWYQCSNRRCIPTSLQCNGDDDCGDASDEYPSVNRQSYNCTNRGEFICGVPVTTSASATPSKSDRYFLGVPGLENLASGFDILTGTRKGDVLSMGPHGSCRRVLKHGLDDYYYRLPNNINSLTQLFSVDEAPGEIVSTAAEYLKLSEDMLALDYAFGGYLNNDDSAMGLTQSEKTKSFSLANIDTQNRYVAVTTTNRVNVFKVELRSPRNLEASNSFLGRLYGLPRDNFSYDRYLAFLRDFGTHYFSSGVLGGQYTSVNLYDRCWIDSELEQTLALTRTEWLEKLAFCDRQSVNNILNPTYEIPSSCIMGASTTSTGVNIAENAIKTDITVMGGSVSTTAKLRDTLSSANWQAWAETVAETPTLLLHDFELTRISKLLDNPLPIFTNDERLKVQQFLDEAISIYLKPYNSASFCNCNDSCHDENENTDSVYSAYLTGTSGKEYYCRCACDNAPRIADCNGSQSTSATSYPTLLVNLLISVSIIRKINSISS